MIANQCMLFAATIQPANPLMRETLVDFGRYVGECIPKFVQKVEVTNGNELDVLIHPDGIVPVMTFLRDHTNAQFHNIVDIAGVDVPAKKCRFEVRH